MIEQHLRKVIGERAAQVTISIPGGEKLAKRTFNGRVGVEGGLSVLGTKGIVRPMSEEAVKDSLVLELNVRIAGGVKDVAFVLGHTGKNGYTNCTVIIFAASRSVITLGSCWMKPRAEDLTEF